MAQDWTLKKCGEMIDLFVSRDTGDAVAVIKDGIPVINRATRGEYDVALQRSASKVIVAKKGIIMTDISLFWGMLIDGFFSEKDIIDEERLLDLPTTAYCYSAPNDGEFEYGSAEFFLEEFDREAFLGRSILMRQLDMLPIICGVRGYHALSSTGNVPKRLLNPSYEPRMRVGMLSGDLLSSHEVNTILEEGFPGQGKEIGRLVKRYSLDLYTMAAEFAESRGLILRSADFYFGVDTENEVVLGGEILTPDTSIYLDAKAYGDGRLVIYGDHVLFEFLKTHLEYVGTDLPVPVSIVSGRLMQSYKTVMERLLGGY